MDEVLRPDRAFDDLLPYYFFVPRPPFNEGDSMYVPIIDMVSTNNTRHEVPIHMHCYPSHYDVYLNAGKGFKRGQLEQRVERLPEMRAGLSKAAEPYFTDVAVVEGNRDGDAFVVYPQLGQTAINYENEMVIVRLYPTRAASLSAVVMRDAFQVFMCHQVYFSDFEAASEILAEHGQRLSSQFEETLKL